MLKMKSKRYLFGLLVALNMGLLVSGCASAPMGLMLNDPLNTDPAVFRFAIREETPLPLKNKGASLTLGYEVTRATPHLTDDVEATFTFEVDPSPRLEDPLKSVENVAVYRLPPADVEALKNWQTRIKQHRSAGGEGKGSIRLALNHGCRTGDLPAGPLYVGIYAKTVAEGRFFLLSPRFDLRTFQWQEDGKSHSLADLPPCQNV